MYSEENYIWGLVAYGLGVVLVLPAMLKVTALVMPWKFLSPLKLVVRAFFVVLLVTPVYAYKETTFFAPAWMVAAFETISPSTPEGPALAYATLTSVFISVFLLIIGFYIARFYWNKHQTSRHQAALQTEPMLAADIDESPV